MHLYWINHVAGNRAVAQLSSQQAEIQQYHIYRLHQSKLIMNKDSVFLHSNDGGYTMWFPYVELEFLVFFNDFNHS